MCTKSDKLMDMYKTLQEKNVFDYGDESVTLSNSKTTLVKSNFFHFDIL